MKRAALLVVLACGVAHAEDKKAAEKAFKLGAKAYAAQNFEAAAINFDEAFKNLALPEIAYSAAQAYRRLYQVDARPEYVHRAIELYEFYLAKVKTGGRVGDAADNLLDMKRELAKLQAAGVATTTVAAPVAHTRLGVNVSAPDQTTAELGSAQVDFGDTSPDSSIKGLAATIDGKPVAAYALVDVTPTEHVVTVSAAGYFPVEKKARAIENQSIYVDVELEPRPAKLTVRTEDAARIIIDGRTVATAPSAPLEVPGGKHLVTVLRNGRKPFDREVTVARGQELVLDAALHETAQRRAAPWVLGGASIAAVGAIATGLVALARDHHATDLRDRITMTGNQDPAVADELDRAITSRDRLVTWTWVLGGVAVVGGAAGGLMLVFDHPDHDSGAVGVRGTF